MQVRVFLQPLPLLRAGRILYKRLDGWPEFNHAKTKPKQMVDEVLQPV